MAILTVKIPPFLIDGLVGLCIGRYGQMKGWTITIIDTHFNCNTIIDTHFNCLPVRVALPSATWLVREASKLTSRSLGITTASHVVSGGPFSVVKMRIRGRISIIERRGFAIDCAIWRRFLQSTFARMQ